MWIQLGNAVIGISWCFEFHNGLLFDEYVKICYDNVILEAKWKWLGI